MVRQTFCFYCCRPSAVDTCPMTFKPCCGYCFSTEDMHPGPFDSFMVDLALRTRIGDPEANKKLIGTFTLVVPVGRN